MFPYKAIYVLRTFFKFCTLKRARGTRRLYCWFFRKQCSFTDIIYWNSGVLGFIKSNLLKVRGCSLTSFRVLIYKMDELLRETKDQAEIRKISVF